MVAQNVHGSQIWWNVGKLLSKARIVDKDGNFLHIGNASIRYLLFFLYSIIMVLKLKEGIDLKVNSHDISHFISTNNGTFSSIGNFIGVITFVECLTVAFNNKNGLFMTLLPGAIAPGSAMARAP